MIIKKSFSIVLVIAILVATIPMTTRIVDAASLTALSDAMSEQTVSLASSHTIKFTTPTGVTASSQTIVVNFPTGSPGFNFSSKAITGLSLTYGPSSGLETTATIAASPGTGTTWGAVFSGSNNITLTLTSPTSGTYIAAGNKVILSYTNTNSINPSSPGDYTIGINANGDTGSVTVPVVSNDQVAVTATVGETLSFAVSNSSIGFGTLSVSSSQYATSSGTGSGSEPTDAHTITASTNGTSGYNITVSGATLSSGLNTIAPITGGSAVLLTPGTEQFGIRAVASGGTGVVSAPFNGADSTHYGFGTSPLSNQAFASAPGATAATTYNVNYAANIAALTPSGSYTTTVTYVATALF